MSGFAVIDFETTGVIPERSDRVVEVGVVLLDHSGQREETWTTLVNPRRDVGASHIHGITGAQVLDAPEFPEIADDLVELLSGRALVAHNASFDMRFLHHELLRAGHQIGTRPVALCSMKWAGRLLGPAKLEHCCAALGIPLTEAHTALADAEATSQLLLALMDMAGASPAWEQDRMQAHSFGLSQHRGTRSSRLLPREGSYQGAPHSWMADVLADTWVPGIPENEAEYLVVLNNALLDFHISATEGRMLVEAAQHSGICWERMVDLHREHLGRLAAEAWSDGVITSEELTDLNSAAACMGLEPSDVTAALDAHRGAPKDPSETLLSEGDRVVFTGTLSRPREAWIADIVEAGLTTGAITKSTSLVVAADPDSLSGKAAKARNYGIPIVDERGFAKHFDTYLDLRRPMVL